MTSSINHPSTGGTVIPDSLRQRIEATLQWKDNVVLALTQAADSLGGNRRRHLMRLSDRAAVVNNADSLLRDAEVLELFLPLVATSSELSQSEERTRQGEIERTVFQVLQRQVRQAQSQADRFHVLLYPLLVLIFSAIVFAGISIMIMPVFEQMFEEFGLTLPTPTAVVISVSHIFQSVWFWLLFAAALISLGGMLGIRMINHLRWMFFGNLEPWGFGGHSSRRTLGQFAWHTALLIEIGLATQTAVEIAASASRQAKMRQNSRQLAEHFGLNHVATDPFIEQPDSLGQSTENWYLGIPCHLLVHGLKLDKNTSQQSSLLREIANIYFDREQTTSIWILSWVQPVVVLLTCLVVGFVLLALFMPLVELISGLA
jgi:type II secretory pathway component PulF